MNAHQAISFQAQLIAAHKERQQRFAEAARRHQQKSKQEKELGRPQDPLWQRADLYFNDHVNRWRLALVKPAACRFKALIKQRCEEWGIDQKVLESSARSALVSRIRFDLYLELRELENPPSNVQIGAMFGGRDHTTVLSGTRKAKAFRAAGDIGLHRDPARQAEILRVFDSVGTLSETMSLVKMNEIALKEFLWMKGRDVVLTDTSTMSWATRQEIRKAVKNGEDHAVLLSRFCITRKTLEDVAGDLFPDSKVEGKRSKAMAKAEMVAKRDADALELYLKGFTYEEIAERVGTTEYGIVRIKRKNGWPDRKKTSRSAGPKSMSRQ